MTRRPAFLCALALCSALLCASLALAAAPPPALEGADIEAAAAAAKNAPATPSLNPITAVNAMNQSIRAGEQQTRAAIESMNRAESKPAKATPAAKPGGGKVIYGDIIIHK
jgi:hypothetical protein